MAELNKDNLEDALSGPRASEVPTPEDQKAAPSQNPNEGSPKGNPQGNAQGQGNVSKEEEIGFHKGALNTLVNERNELLKMMQNVEAVMQAHIARLEQLGVKVPVNQGQQRQQ